MQKQCHFWRRTSSAMCFACSNFDSSCAAFPSVGFATGAASVAAAFACSTGVATASFTCSLTFASAADIVNVIAGRSLQEGG